MAEVQDRDHGWSKLVKSTMIADGLELRNGIINWRLRYPGKKGTEIAKVAGILDMYSAISMGYDDARGVIEKAFVDLQAYLANGGTDPAGWIHEHMGVPIRGAMRARAVALHRKTGRMSEAIRSTVFDTEGKRGSRANPMTGKVAAGDDPKKPTPSEAV